MSWGESGSEPGQFNIAHNIATDDDGWVYVADRENHRVQVFDGNGKYETQWNNLHRPCGLYCCRGKSPTFVIGELGPGMPVNLKAPNLGPRLSIVDAKGKLHRAPRRQGRPGPGGRQVHRAARPGARLEGRHLRRRGLLHQLEDELPGYPATQDDPFTAEACARALKRTLEVGQEQKENAMRQGLPAVSLVAVPGRRRATLEARRRDRTAGVPGDFRAEPICQHVAVRGALPPHQA